MRPKRTTWIILPLTALLLAACSVTPEPELDAARFSSHAQSSLRVWFLPPVGQPYHGHDEDFDGSLDLSIAIFNLDPDTKLAYGDALPPALSTQDGSIRERRDVYEALWRVKTTARDHDAGSYLRLEIRHAGASEDPVCNVPGSACLGYLDVHLDNGGPRWDDQDPRWDEDGPHPQHAEVEVAGRHHHPGPSGFLEVNPDRTLPIKFMVEAASGGVPETLSELRSPFTDEPLDEELGNCPAGERDTPSQGLQAVGAGLQAVGAGLQAVGAVGGVFVGPATVFTGKIVSPWTVAHQVAYSLQDMPAAVQMQGYSHHPSGHEVAILVVDDFADGAAYHLPHAITWPNEDLDGAALAQLFADGSLAHGALVFHQLQFMAWSAGYRYLRFGENGVTGEPYVKLTNAYGDRILLQAVDTSQFDTDAMPDAIRDSLDHVVGALGFDRVVVNMSFAVVPCAVTADFDLGNLDTFEAYLAALGASNGIDPSLTPELAKLVVTPVALADDPLFQYIACPLPATDGSATCDGSHDGRPGKLKTIVHVAASGNYGMDYALYPAALPQVISVGSVDVTPTGYATTRSAFSNGAEVLAPGALFKLSRHDGVVVAYAGTSFAAPVVSLLEALDLSRDTPRCDPGSVAGAPSTAPALAYGSFENQPVLDADGERGPALQQHCAL